MNIIAFDHLPDSDLNIDAVYDGGNSGNASDDPIARLLPGVGNQGGFRRARKNDRENYVVLYTSGEDNDWPDNIDLNTGLFRYFGDNKKPGHELHDTPRRGNLLLREVFGKLHASPSQRNLIPPFLVFLKYPTSRSRRSVQFKGVAVPGFPGLAATDDLVAIWKTTNNQRFQNYRAAFTLLDIHEVKRSWIEDLRLSRPISTNTPEEWRTWVDSGKVRPLASTPTTTFRSIMEQRPQTALQQGIIDTIFDYFSQAPKRFEACAAQIFRFYDSRVIIDEITRGSVDGGRDAIGRYRLGVTDDPVYMEFALEAKCYRPSSGTSNANTVGVKETSRLISRIRHRQFGVLVTTSLIARQAYEEIRRDQHPIVLLCGKDIADILIQNGFNSVQIVEEWLRREFPL